jgi:MFS transporter, putative metabolite:H+ symporter
MLSAERHIAARLDRLPMSRGLWKLVLLISLGGAFELYDIFLSTYITPGLTAGGMFTTMLAKGGAASFFAINSVGFFISCNFAGMFVGCVGFGYVADRLGRRSIFVFSLLWYSICTAIMACQSTALGVDLWRFIAGIGVGLEQVTIDTFLPEIVPPQSRGRAFAFYQFVEFCAVPIVALLGWLLVPLHPLGLEGWRWVALIGSLGAMVVWWLRRTLPESPRWLAAHGRADEADRVLTELEARAVLDTGAPLPEPVTISAAVPVVPGTFGELFRPPYARRTLVLSVFNLMQTVAFYGFGSWVPTLLIAKGILVTTSQMYAFIIAIANPIGPLLGMLIADRMERKWQIVSAGVAIAVFATLFAKQANQALVIVFGVAVTLSNNWMSFAFHNYQGELFPTRVRARAVGFVYSWSRVSATFASLVINFLLVRGGAPAVAAFIAAAMLVMTVTIGGFGPRTRSLTLEEISR